MSESIITDIYVGKYVLVQLVDSTVELTVENNVYSLTEATELEQDLLQALYTLRKEKILKMSKGDKVWFTDPDGDLSSGLYTIDRICGEVYSLSNDDGAVEAFEHELEVCEDE